MADSRFLTLREIVAPKVVRGSLGGVTGVAAYDGVSSQFDLPKLGKVLGMSGSLLPWWGWLLILQAIFVYGLFEYVRRRTGPDEPPAPVVGVEAWSALFDRASKLESASLEQGQRLERLEERLTSEVERLTGAVRQYADLPTKAEVHAEVKHQTDLLSVHRVEPLGKLLGEHYQTHGALADRVTALEAANVKSDPDAEFDAAFAERVSGMMPFVRLREDAPKCGIPLPRIGPGQNNAYHLEGALQQAAVRGELKVEGRQYRGAVQHNDPLVPIPPEHFREYGFAHGVLNYDLSNEASHTGDVRMMSNGERGMVGVTFYDLHLSIRDALAVVRALAKDPKIERP